MKTDRLEAFSDGVIAIIITIMVLDLKVPASATFAALSTLVPVLLSYVLSFLYVGIYWNNHHHMLHASGAVTGRILWANLHLLFWLSLFPFVTTWVGQHPAAAAPTAVYGAVLLMAAFAYWLLQHVIILSQGPDSILKKAVGSDWKGRSSPPLYVLGIALAFRAPWAAQSVFLAVALLWFIPDRRIERILGAHAR